MVNINDIYAKAIKQWQSSNFIEAKNYFKKIQKKQPANAEILSYIGILDLQLKNFKDGISCLKKANTINPSDKNIKVNLSNGLIDYSNELINKNLFSQAIDVLEESITFLPNNEATYLNLMRLYIAEKKFNKVKEKYEFLKKINPKNSNMYFLYANSLFDQREFQAAIYFYEDAISLKPEFIECHFHLALCYEFIGKIKDALNKYDECLKINPNYDLALFNKSQLLLAINFFDEGWELYQKRWSLKKNLGRYFFNPKQELLIDSHFEKDIFIWAEQGVGDQILFASMLNDFNSLYKKITVSADKRLVSLFKRSFPKIKFIDQEKYLTVTFDRHLPMGNIGKFVRKDMNDFQKQKPSYLFEDKSLKNKFLSRFDKSKKIKCGLSWTSKNLKYGESKSLNFDTLAKYLNKEKFYYINLEYIQNQKEINNAIDKYHFDIYGAFEIDKFNDLESFAALVACCDLVVTISNVTAHFAGAMGIKTVLLVPYSYGRFWYWSDNEKSKWYPSVKIIRQKDQFGWSEALKELEDYLINF